MIRAIRCALASLLVHASMLIFGVPGCGPHVEFAGSCTPHARELCYTGPEGTEGVGRCRAGLRTCADDASGFGPCVGEVLPAPEACDAAGDENCDGKTVGCTGNTLWARRYVLSSDYAYPEGISTDASGNAVLAMQVYEDVDIGAPIGVLTPSSGRGSAILKINGAGDPIFGVLVDGPIWYLSIGSDAVGNTAVFGEMYDFGGITLNGQKFMADSDNALMFSLDPAGNTNFAKEFVATDWVDAGSLGTRPTGDIVIAGHNGGGADFGGGPLSGAYLVRYSATGAYVFDKQLPLVEVRASQFDGQGNIVLSGEYYYDANFGGETLPSVGESSYFVVKLGPSGEHLWSKRFGLGKSNHPSSFTSEPDGAGNVYLAGAFSDTWDFGGGPVTAKAPKGDTDGFLVKLDPNGNYLWGKYFGNGNSQRIGSVAIDATGNIVIGASFSGSIDFGAGMLYSASSLASDIAVAKFTPDGDIVWSRRFGAGSYIGVSGLALAPAGEVLVMGAVAQDIDFGMGVLPAKSYGPDIFVVKLEP